MNIFRATESYEQWLGTHVKLVHRDLRMKHEQMRVSSFSFLRATFYRWMQVWREAVPEAATAPRVLAVGDLHIENFGTWRDCEGRLIWGINDFDESSRLPYTLDLIRLVASAHLAIEEEQLALRPRAASEAVLEGYLDGFEAGGETFTLGEQHRWLRDIAVARLRDPTVFWRKLDTSPSQPVDLPTAVLRAAQELLPARGLACRRRHRVAGLGSLGHARIVLIGLWGGGRVVREAKQLAPSACLWAGEPASSRQIRYSEILRRAVRVPDPYVRAFEGWLIRRLAPDCSRIEISSLPAKRDEGRLLYAMGWETANIHLGSRASLAAIKNDLRKRQGSWLHRAAREMAESVRRDWKKWRSG